MAPIATTRPPRPPRTMSARQRRAKDGINAALALFNKRWVLRILWELRGDALTFRALQSASGDLSTSVLNLRLAELREALLVEHMPGAGYALSAHGRSLLVAMRPLLDWAAAWAAATQPRR